MNFQVSYQFSLIFITYVCLSLLKIQVHGIVRRSSSFNTGRIEHLYKNPQAHIEGSKFLSQFFVASYFLDVFKYHYS